jgi:hypothetical protein
MADLIAKFPALNDLDEFHEFVSAVREKEQEAGISMRKLRTWLGQYGEMPLVRDILCIDPEWKNNPSWRRHLLSLVMTVRLPGSRAQLPPTVRVHKVLQGAIVENVPFDEVCARVRRVDPAADNDHVRAWLADEAERDARETVPSVACGDAPVLDDGDIDDDRTIPVSRLDQMSRAPETVRSAAAPPRSSAAGQTAENNVNTGKLNIVDVLVRVNPTALDKDVLTALVNNHTQVSISENALRLREIDERIRAKDERIRENDVRLREVETEVERTEAQIRLLEAKRRTGQKRGRDDDGGAAPGGVDPMDPIDESNWSRWQKLARQPWNGMRGLSAAVWAARPPDETRTLPDIFAAVQTSLMQLLPAKAKFRLRMLPNSPEIEAVYVSLKVDKAECVRRFWNPNKADETATSPPQLSSSSSPDASAPSPTAATSSMAPPPPQRSEGRVLAPRRASLLTAVTVGLPAGTADVFVRSFLDTPAMAPWNGVFFVKQFHRTTNELTDVLGPLGVDRAGLDVHPVVRRVRAWLARAVADAAVCAHPPPFLGPERAPDDARPPPPPQDGCEPLPSDPTELWRQTVDGTFATSVLAPYFSAFARPTAAAADVGGYVAAVHPERIRHLAAVTGGGKTWFTYTELAEILGWESVRGEFQLVPLLALAAQQRRRPGVAASSWWLRSGKPQKYHTVALRSLRQAAAVVARLVAHGFDSEQRKVVTMELFRKLPCIS